MAGSTELPSEERVRELTADPNLSDEDIGRYGDLFINAGRFAQALMFLERSKDASRLGRVTKEAIRIGDAFLLHGVTRISADAVSEGDWRSCGDEAMRQGKFLFARDCYEKSGDEEKMRAAREEWLKVFPSSAPPPATPA